MGGGAAIGIMCKAPHAGATKTRLVPELGAQGAADLSACFLRDLSTTIAALPRTIGVKGYAIFSPKDAEAELRTILSEEFGFLHHSGSNFGAVLLSAMRSLLALRHDCVLLVNSDSPTLPPELLKRAIATLREEGDRVVFGPAIDGGYYLVGLKTAHARLFEEVPWSTQDVLSSSLERAADIDLPVTLLDAWYDVDDAASLGYLRDELAGHPPFFLPAGIAGAAAETTRRFLAGLNKGSSATNQFSNAAPKR